MTKVVNKNGDKEEFDEGKLWHSIYYPAREAHYSEGEAVELADRAKHRIVEWVERHDDDVLTSEEMRQKVSKVILNLDEDVEFLYRKHLDIN